MTGSTTEIDWYIARDGQQHGPISDVEMRLFVEQGHLKPSDLVWRAGFADWRPAPVVFPPMAPPARPEAQVAPAAKAAEAATGGAAGAVGAPQTASSSHSPWPSPSPSPSPISTPSGSSASGQAAVAGGSPAGVGNAVSDGSAAVAAASAKIVQDGRFRAEPAAVSPATSSTPASGTPVSRTLASEPAQPRQPVIAVPSRPQSGDSGAVPLGGGEEEANYDVEADSGSGRGKRLALAAALVAMIAGSAVYLYAHKDDILQLAGVAQKPATVPVVKAKPTTVAALKKPDAPEAVAPPVAAQNTAANMSDAVPEPDRTAAKQAPAVGAPQAGVPTGEMVPQNLAAAQPVTPPPAAPPAATPPAAAVPAAPAVPSARAAIDAQYQKSRLWSFMKRAHPDWYDEQVGTAAKLIDENRTQRDATQHMVEAMVALRRRHAESALKADSVRLKVIASAFLANLQALAQRGPDVCYSFISQGESSPAVIDIIDKQQGAEPLEGQAIAIFEAVAAGKSQPASHERPKKEDYDVLAGELGKLGWSQADLQLFADPKALAKASPERVCKMVRDWFKAHIEISDGAVQERLLFETLRPVVAG